MTDSHQLIDALESRAERRNERREFFRTALGAAAVATAGAGMMQYSSSARAQDMGDNDGPDDAAVLNFALNLEYLEANFYHYAVYGTTIPANLQTGTGTQGGVIGGRKVNFQNQMVANYAKEIAGDELAHVTFLRTALGGAAVAQPMIDVGTNPSGAFSKAAQAAGLVPAGQSFDPYANDLNFLLGSFIFEDVGVTAYHGGAGFLTNPTYLEAAAGILAVEAYHASIIRTSLYSMGVNTPTPRNAADAISDARDSLDGDSDIDQGISPVSSMFGGQESNIVPLDDNGIAFTRTPEQVHNVVYLTPDEATKGGFFPMGTNGTLTTSGDSSTY